MYTMLIVRYPSAKERILCTEMCLKEKKESAEQRKKNKWLKFIQQQFSRSWSNNNIDTKYRNGLIAYKVLCSNGVFLRIISATWDT